MTSSDQPTSPAPAPEPAPRPPAAWRGWLAFALALAVTFLLGLLAASIMERRREAIQPAQILVPIPEDEPDSAVWGKNFPREFQAFNRTIDTGQPTRYGGNQPFSWLERDPLLLKLFQGYPFAIEYNEDQGHMHALEDVRKTARRDPGRGGKPQPGTCMTCKSSDVPRLMKELGPAKFYSMTFDELDKRVHHTIGCADCHDSKTMNLRISRPALREALVSMGRDPEKIPHQELRSLVCAQCHVEYYFAKRPPDDKPTYLTFPWKLGLDYESIEKYYTDVVRHTDWVHPVSKTPMIKMQHPDYELYTRGVYAYRGVTCADCHMPYRSEGGVKFTDHYIRSPLKNISNSCAVCHRWSEAEITQRVYGIQDATRELMDRAERNLVAAHNDIAQAMAKGATDGELAEPRDLLRRSQARWDFIASSNGMGFHAPQEYARLLGTSIDLAGESRLRTAALGKGPPTTAPALPPRPTPTTRP